MLFIILIVVCIIGIFIYINRYRIFGTATKEQILDNNNVITNELENSIEDIQENSNVNVVEHTNNFGNVPNQYYSKIQNGGTLEKITYQTQDYVNGGNITKNAIIYLPYGYDKLDSTTKYDVMYLQHGAYGRNTTWLGNVSNPNSLKNMIDNMIANNNINPLIIVCPYIEPGNDWYASTSKVFYNELKNDLMPYIEENYNTNNSREHRIFGGFSMGGSTTWSVFYHELDEFKYFLPMSGQSWNLGLVTDGSNANEVVKNLIESIRKNNYSTKDYYIFAATGTRDVAYSGLSKQIDEMKKEINYFKYTSNNFNDGNFMYYTVEGNQHDYQYTYEYIYNGLQMFYELIER